MSSVSLLPISLKRPIIIIVKEQTNQTITSSMKEEQNSEGKDKLIPISLNEDIEKLCQEQEIEKEEKEDQEDQEIKKEKKEEKKTEHDKMYYNNEISYDNKEINNYRMTLVGKKISDKSILPDLNNIEITDDIKQKSLEIFQKMGSPSRRGNRRKLLIFDCIYHAYKELGYNKNPIEISTLLGLDKNKITKALSMYGAIHTKYQISEEIEERVTPITFIYQYFNLTGLNDNNIIPLIQLTEEILQKDSKLYDDHFPQEVAVAIIMYYMTINGIKYNINKFLEIINKSQNTLTNIYNKVAKAHNM